MILLVGSFRKVGLFLKTRSLCSQDQVHDKTFSGTNNGKKNANKTSPEQFVIVVARNSKDREHAGTKRLFSRGCICT